MHGPRNHGGEEVVLYGHAFSVRLDLVETCHEPLTATNPVTKRGRE